LDSEPGTKTDYGTTITKALSCAGCRYDLRGLTIEGVCPECGRPVLDSVRRAVDPAAHRLPRIHDPDTVGDALVWLMSCLLAAMLLLVATPAVHQLAAQRIGGVVRHPTMAILGTLAGLVLLTGLGSVRQLAPPRGGETAPRVRRYILRMALGLVAAGLGAIARANVPVPANWALDAGTTAAGAVIGAGLGILTVGGLALTLGALGGVFRVIGERSREYRTASGGRQRTADMVAATGGVVVGELLGLLGFAIDSTPVAVMATMVVWACLLMLVIGLGYLLMNAVWIRRSLKRPPPTLPDLLGDDLEDELAKKAPGNAPGDAPGNAGDEGPASDA